MPTARAELKRAHERMGAPAIAEHALFLADLLSHMHNRVLPSLAGVTDQYANLIDAQHAALESLNGAIGRAIELLDSGQASQARDVLITLAAVQLVKPELPARASLPVLPAGIFSPSLGDRR